MTGDQIADIAAAKGVVSVTEDAPIQATAYGNLQNWPSSDRRPVGRRRREGQSIPTIAIVDSGVEWRGDFYRRLIRQVDLTTTAPNSSGDGFGHGTLVAGLAVGDADRFTGVEPRANIVSLDVLDDAGNGTVSNLLAACDWILQNKGRYNIDVANFSIERIERRGSAERSARQGGREALAERSGGRRGVGELRDRRGRERRRVRARPTIRS